MVVFENTNEILSITLLIDLTFVNKSCLILRQGVVKYTSMMIGVLYLEQVGSIKSLISITLSSKNRLRA